MKNVEVVNDSTERGIRLAAGAQSTELVWILDFKQILLLLLFKHNINGIQVSECVIGREERPLLGAKTCHKFNIDVKIQYVWLKHD